MKILISAARCTDDDSSEQARGQLSNDELHSQNQEFIGTKGVSEENQEAGFRPAYRHAETGEAMISCFSDGTPAPVHVLEGLPATWVTARDSNGKVTRVSSAVVAGFLRNGIFYTREDAVRACNE